MKKLLVVLLVCGLLGGGGWLLYSRYGRSTEQRTCDRVKTLCGEKEARSCEEAMSELRRLGGSEAAERASACIAEAKSCISSVGCFVGAGLGSLGELFEGIKRGLSDEK